MAWRRVGAMVVTVVVAVAAGAVGEETVQVRARELIGRPAPALAVSEVLAGPGLEAWSPEALRGRTVVIDFWATWCAPCIEDLPRWNAMVDELADEPVVFLAISDEPADVVAGLLAKRRLAGWVAVDPEASVFDRFAVTGRPQAVLIDAEGVVRGVGHTGEVTPAMVRRLVAGEDPGLVPSSGVDEMLAEVGRAGAAAAIYQVGLWPTEASGGLMTTGADGFVAIGLGVKVMVPFLWRVGAARVLVEDDVPAGRFDLVVRPAGDAERVEELGRQALEAGLGLEVRRELREVEVAVLRLAGADGDGVPAPDRLREASTAEAPQFEAGPGRLAGNRVAIAELSAALERELRRPVVDETGLSGEYAVDLAWAAGESGALVAALERLGLEVVEGRREVEMVVVARR